MFLSELTSGAISNMLGQKLFTKELHTTTAQIDISYLPTGTYFVEFFAGNSSKIIKLVKN
jgi:large repetitive protein